MSRNETSYSLNGSGLCWRELCLCLAMRRLTACPELLIPMHKLCLCLAMRRLTASQGATNGSPFAVSMSRNETSYSLFALNESVVPAVSMSRNETSYSLRLLR